MGRMTAAGAAGARLSIGALARATGIPVETLRTWEMRYGFPAPERKPSGHRVYPLASVARLRRIAEALSRGHRAGEVVAASEADLSALLQDTRTASSGTPPAAHLMAPFDPESAIAAIAAFDAEGVTRLLLAEWARTSPVDFLEARVAPLVREVGRAWADGRLEIRHEHFFSERLGDLLRSLRLPIEERARGPLVTFASLPGEGHGLGLQMAALVTAWAGCRVLCLGLETPAAEIVGLSRDLNARAVGVSVSAASRGPRSAAQIRALRERLPRRVALLVGGDGAPSPHAGIEVMRDLRELESWARQAASRAS
jgi:DNA-binding transcriptional MerR regulator/methylmalonyl-CoA mutase cobalamin-binding subunit